MVLSIPSTCPTFGCDHETPCPEHPIRRRPNDKRDNSYRRGYGGKAWHRARAIVLRRDPLCVAGPELAPGGCDNPSTRADHYPRSRRELVAAGVPDPDAPELMRGLCEPCHNRHTGRTRR